jgi:hypothetical protein
MKNGTIDSELIGPKINLPRNAQNMIAHTKAPRGTAFSNVFGNASAVDENWTEG